MKTRLSIIALMFVVINLIFYFVFGSSEESDESIELDNDGKNKQNVEKNTELKQEIANPITS